MFASEIRKKRRIQLRSHSNWQGHFDEVFVNINGERQYFWRSVYHEGEVVESYVSKCQNRKAALKFIRKSMKINRQPRVIITDKIRSFRAAMMIMGNADRQETGHWVNNRAENSYLPFRQR